MSKKFDYDLIVIGSGSAGASAAIYASNAGLKTALVERGKWGGSSLNYTDIPSRALFEFAHLYRKAQNGARFGISSSTLRYNYPTAQNWRSLTSRRAGAGSKKAFEAAKIACFSGFASFLSPYELAVKDQIISAPRFIIATGSKLNTGDITGTESTACLTPAEALATTRPPKTVFIVGGGSTGVELANYFAELGSKVTIAEIAERLLPHEDEEVGTTIARYFETQLRIKVLTESRVIAVEKSVKPGIQRVVFRRGGQEKTVETATIVLATGSNPATNLGLENAGVSYDIDGITVDNYLRTKVKHIYAAGDCIGGESSAERAAYEGVLAASNLLSKAKCQRSYDGFIRVTDTFPSVATSGLTEHECVDKRIPYKKVVLPLSSVSAANTSDFLTGFIKLLADHKSRVIGATIVCPEAPLAIQEVTLAIRHKLTVDQLSSTPHVATTWSELVRLASSKLVR